MRLANRLPHSTSLGRYEVRDCVIWAVDRELPVSVMINSKLCGVVLENVRNVLVKTLFVGLNIRDITVSPASPSPTNHTADSARLSHGTEQSEKLNGHVRHFPISACAETAAYVHLRWSCMYRLKNNANISY